MTRQQIVHAYVEALANFIDAHASPDSPVVGLALFNEAGEEYLRFDTTVKGSTGLPPAEAVAELRQKFLLERVEIEA